MITFTNPKDSKTLKVVYSEKWRGVSKRYQPIDHFEDTFGEGVKLKKVTIEMTSEPMTLGAVNKYLPSFGKETGF